ncbi:MAG: hypothetical protein AB7E96_12195 [Deferribacterales bacterium]
MERKKKSTVTPAQAAVDRVELDTLTAEMLVAEETVAENLPTDQHEREALIAEAYKLTGRIEGINFISKVATVASLMLLKKIKEEKIYKQMPNVGTWENYCQSIGYSRRQIDENLQNLEVMGEEFLATVATFGLGYRELRQLRSAAGDGKLEVTDNSIVIASGDVTETIPLNDKDEVKDALERLLSSKDKELEKERQATKAAQKVAKAKDDTINKMGKDLAAYEAAADATGLSADESKFIRNIQNIKILLTGQLVKLERHNLPDNMTPAMEKEFISVTKAIYEHISDIRLGFVYDESEIKDEPELPCTTCANEAECGRTRFYSTGYDTYACDNKTSKGE